MLCSPTLNQLLELTNSICQCAGIENQVGIFVADSDTDNSAPGEQVPNTHAVWLYNQKRHSAARDAIIKKDITQVKIDEPMTLNELLAIIDVVCRCAGIDEDVVGIAEPMMAVIDAGHRGQSTAQELMLH
ncbi:hypothetical protein ACJ8CM_01765 [Klebsiella pneumoniae]